MEIKSNVGLHNKFVIEVRDAETNELKQTATSYNIILDQMYTRLCGGSTYFVNIHFGTGTGTLSPTRTSLFTHLGTKTAVNEQLVKGFPNSSWTRKIVINPEEFVGSTFREVGIAFGAGTSNLVTHSLLKDIDGNPLEITKTATDVITIYATVFVVLDTSNPKIKYIGVPNYNTLLNYLVGGGAAPSGTLVLNSVFSGSAPLGTSPSLTFSANTPLKRRQSSLVRFGTTVGNGHIKYLEMPDVFSLEISSEGTYPGTSYTGVTLGVGDGVKTVFELPSHNVVEGTIQTRLDGVLESSVVIPAVKSFNSGYDGASSKHSLRGTSGQFGASSVRFNMELTEGVVAYRGSPFVELLERVNEMWFIKPFSPLELKQSVLCAEISGDGNTIAVVYDSLNAIHIYKRISGTWSFSNSITTPSNFPVYPASSPVRNLSRIFLNEDGSSIAFATGSHVGVYTLIEDAWVLGFSRSHSAACAFISADGATAVFIADGLTSSVLARLVEGVWSHNTTSVFGTTSTSNFQNVTYTPSLSHLGFSSIWSGTAISVIIRLNSDNTTTILAHKNTGALSYHDSRFGINHDMSMFVGETTGFKEGPIPANQPTLRSASSGFFSGFSVSPILFTPSGDRVVRAGIQNTTGFALTIEEMSKESSKPSVSFSTPPAAGVNVTADYTVEGIHKTDQYVVDASFAIQFGEIVE